MIIKYITPNGLKGRLEIVTEEEQTYKKTLKALKSMGATLLKR